jgi:hypothetical protein
MWQQLTIRSVAMRTFYSALAAAMGLALQFSAAAQSSMQVDDINNDGIPEQGFIDSRFQSSFVNEGRVEVRDGASQEIIWNRSGEAIDVRMGYSWDIMPGNAAATQQIVYSIPGRIDCAGSSLGTIECVRILDGTVRWTMCVPGRMIGSSVAVIPDHDSDGVDEVLAETFASSIGESGTPSFVILSGNSGSLIREFSGSFALARQLALAGVPLYSAADFDGDGSVTGIDLAALTQASLASTPDLAFDLTHDGLLDSSDIQLALDAFQNNDGNAQFDRWPDGFMISAAKRFSDTFASVGGTASPPIDPNQCPTCTPGNGVAAGSRCHACGMSARLHCPSSHVYVGEPFTVDLDYSIDLIPGLSWQNVAIVDWVLPPELILNQTPSGNPTLTPTSPGLHTYSVIVRNGNCCFTLTCAVTAEASRPPPPCEPWHWLGIRIDGCPPPLTLSSGTFPGAVLPNQGVTLSPVFFDPMMPEHLFPPPAPGRLTWEVISGREWIVKIDRLYETNSNISITAVSDTPQLISVRLRYELYTDCYVEAICSYYVSPDLDDDFLLDVHETFSGCTRIDLPNSDTDSVPDGSEVWISHTNPCDGSSVDNTDIWFLQDGDRDGLTDYEEMRGVEIQPFGYNAPFKVHSSPLKFDTDGDGSSDYVEVRRGSIPTDSQSRAAGSGLSSFTIDSDRDGLPDLYEQQRGLDPASRDSDNDGFDDASEVRNRALDPLAPNGGPGRPVPAAGGGVDSDGDGLSDTEEELIGTDPHRADTDSDGLADGDESIHGSNPLSFDSDNDGVSDGFEAANGLDPTNSDSDSDGILDGDEDDDQDGYSNYDEEMYGTDPTTADPPEPQDTSGCQYIYTLRVGAEPRIFDEWGSGVNSRRVVQVVDSYGIRLDGGRILRPRVASDGIATIRLRKSQIPSDPTVMRIELVELGSNRAAFNAAFAAVTAGSLPEHLRVAFRDEGFRHKAQAVYELTLKRVNCSQPNFAQELKFLKRAFANGQENPRVLPQSRFSFSRMFNHFSNRMFPSFGFSGELANFELFQRFGGPSTEVFLHMLLDVDVLSRYCCMPGDNQCDTTAVGSVNGTMVWFPIWNPSDCGLAYYEAWQTGYPAIGCNGEIVPVLQPEQWPWYSHIMEAHHELFPPLYWQTLSPSCSQAIPYVYLFPRTDQYPSRGWFDSASREWQDHNGDNFHEHTSWRPGSPSPIASLPDEGNYVYFPGRHAYWIERLLESEDSQLRTEDDSIDLAFTDLHVWRDDYGDAALPATLSDIPPRFDSPTEVIGTHLGKADFIAADGASAVLLNIPRGVRGTAMLFRLPAHRGVAGAVANGEFSYRHVRDKRASLLEPLDALPHFFFASFPLTDHAGNLSELPWPWSVGPAKPNLHGGFVTRGATLSPLLKPLSSAELIDALPLGFGPFTSLKHVCVFGSGDTLVYVPPESYVTARANQAVDTFEIVTPLDGLDPSMSDFDNPFAFGGQFAEDWRTVMVVQLLAPDGTFLCNRIIDIPLVKPQLVAAHGTQSSAVATFTAAPPHDTPWVRWIATSSGLRLPEVSVGAPINYVDYSSLNTLGFAEVFHIIPKTIQYSLRQYRPWLNAMRYDPSVSPFLADAQFIPPLEPPQQFRNASIAATRVDLVAHSQGGQAARLYMSSTVDDTVQYDRPYDWPDANVVRINDSHDTSWNRTYLRGENFALGDVHRFIPVGSPFKGSCISHALLHLLGSKDVRFPRLTLAFHGDPHNAIMIEVSLEAELTRDQFFDSVLVLFGASVSNEIADLRSKLYRGPDGTFLPPTTVADLSPDSAAIASLQQAIYPSDRLGITWAPATAIADLPSSVPDWMFWYAQARGTLPGSHVFTLPVGDINKFVTDQVVGPVAQATIVRMIRSADGATEDVAALIRASWTACRDEIDVDSSDLVVPLDSQQNGGTGDYLGRCGARSFMFQTGTTHTRSGREPLLDYEMHDVDLFEKIIYVLERPRFFIPNDGLHSSFDYWGMSLR